MSTLFHSKRTTAMVFLAVLTATTRSGVDARMDLLTHTMRQASAALLDDWNGAVGTAGFPNAQRSLQDNSNDVCSTDPQDIFDDDDALQVHSSTYNPTCTCKDTNALEDYEEENAFPESMEGIEAWLEALNRVAVVDLNSPPTFEESYDCSNQCSLCFENTTTNDRYCAVASRVQDNTAHIGFTSPFTLEEFMALGMASILGDNNATTDAGAEFEATMMERVAAFGSSVRTQRCLNVLESSNDDATGEICFIQELSFSSEEGIPAADLDETVFLQGDLACSFLYQGEECNSCTLDLETETMSVDCANMVPDAVFDDFSNVAMEDAPGLFRPFLLFANMNASEYTLGTCDLPADSTSGSSSSSSTSDSTTASSSHGHTMTAGFRFIAVFFLIPLMLGMW